MVEEAPRTDLKTEISQSDIETLTHEDLLEITQSSLRRLTASDPLLQDLPVDVTLEEVLSQIAVLQGQSITVTIDRYSEPALSVVIPQQGATVLDLRKALQRCYILTQQRQRNRTKINWKYIWKTYYLQDVDSKIVLDDFRKPVTEYGIRNKSVCRFVKKLRKKTFGRND